MGSFVVGNISKFHRPSLINYK